MLVDSSDLYFECKPIELKASLLYVGNILTISLVRCYGYFQVSEICMSFLLIVILTRLTTLVKVYVLTYCSPFYSYQSLMIVRLSRKNNERLYVGTKVGSKATITPYFYSGGIYQCPVYCTIMRDSLKNNIWGFVL